MQMQFTVAFKIKHVCVCLISGHAEAPGPFRLPPRG